MAEVVESEILAAARAGQVLDCADGSGRQIVDAVLIRRCCREWKDQVDPRGLRLHRAVVAGCLDLAGMEVPFPLRFDECDFDSPPVADGAQLFELALTGCARLPGLLANGLRVRRDLDLSGSCITGGHTSSASTTQRAAIWLCESDIGGRLVCRNTVIRGEGGRSVQADRFHVGGGVRFLDQFTAYGEMRLLGARIDGSLDLTGAHVEARTGLALDLSDMVLGGSVFVIPGAGGRRPVINGRIDLGSARVGGQILIRDATLNGSDVTPTGSGYSQTRAGGAAVSAPRLSVGAEVVLEGACHVTGGMDLSMSEMSRLVLGGDASLLAAGRTALDLTNAEFRSSMTLGRGAVIAGSVLLGGARIHGALSLGGATLSQPGDRSLVAASGVTVDGDLDLTGLRTSGGNLNFRSARLGGAVDATGVDLSNPGGYTLSLHQASVNGTVLLKDATSDGLVMLNRAEVGGRLRCTGSTFTCPAPAERNEYGHAITAISATFRGGMDLGWSAVTPSADFTNATTSFLADDPENWPPRFTVSGFTYDRFEQPQGRPPARIWDPDARIGWLNRQRFYDASPYEHAARVYRQHGYASQAEQILIAQRTNARHAITGRGARLRSGLNIAYGITVGYGYRPARVLWLLAVLLIFVAGSLEIPADQAAMRATTPAGIIYTTHGPILANDRTSTTQSAAAAPSAVQPASDACGNGQVRCFSPVLYAIDTVIPLISLDQRSTWYPNPHTRYGNLLQWWLNTATLLGWLLSSIFVLSLARLARTT